MKTLQNNFTTPEQSKRLLELGVPANSADLFYHEGARSNLERGMFLSTLEGYENFDKAVIGYRKYLSDKDMKAVPCWSVGRLMEIWDICGNTCECVTAKRDETRTELLVKLYEVNATYADFSKLEEQE